MRKLTAVFLTLALAISGPIMAQAAAETTVPFGSIGGHDTTKPVEIVSDTFSVDQKQGLAVFTGNVVVVQDEMRLTADKIEVIYASSENGASGDIETLNASGNVLITTPGEEAAADHAVYSLKQSKIVLDGNAMLSRGTSAVTSRKMTIDLKNSTAHMEGRVKTVFQTKSKN